MKKSNNIISDWLDKFGDPEIDKKVEMELEKINKERYNQIKMEIKVEFEVYSDNESLIERFLSDYPNATYEVDETIIFKNDEWESIDDVDTFLCEEICHEYETYCYISDDNIRKEYYYDEEDEWFEKTI